MLSLRSIKPGRHSGSILVFLFCLPAQSTINMTDENYTDLPLYIQRMIVPVDFPSLKHLPESHSWSQSAEVSFTTIMPDAEQQPSLPIIDLADPNATELVGRACEEWGAFQMVNHGIPLNLMEEVEFQAKRFFALPAKQKVKALRSPDSATGYGKALISSFFPKQMWHEGFTIRGSPMEHVKSIWPNNCVQFCDVMKIYQQKMKLLAEKLTNIIFNFLDIPEDQRNWVGSEDSVNPCITAFQLNSYPTCPDPSRAMGLAPHTDTSLLTILYQSQTQSGLQIFKGGAGWIPVIPNPNALVVQMGDILHIISNARFPSALHRAMVNSTQHRYSVAYFYSPPEDCVVSPGFSADRVLKSGQVARFRPVTIREFSANKYKHLDKAFSLIGFEMI